MICSVMQPTYLPWSGYFNLINQADIFIFYDCARFSKGSWHNRNRIFDGKQDQWITVPVIGKSEGSLSNKKINWQSKWTKKHINTIKSIYGKSPYFKDLNGLLDTIENLSDETLSECNIKIIKWFMLELSIHTTTMLSSDLAVTGERSEKLLALINATKADTYLSPQGAKDYIESDDVLPRSDLNVVYQDFTPGVYKQFNSKSDFLNRLSIVDVIANIGMKETSGYIKGN